MKLLWVTARRFGVDHCQTTQLSLAKHMVSMGWEIQFICPNNCSPPEDLTNISFQGTGIGGPPGLRGPLFEMAVKKRIKRLLKEYSPDAAIVDWRCTVGSRSELNKKGIPWFIIDRGPPAHSGILAKLQKIHYRKSWKAASKSASGGFVVSRKHAEYIKRNHSNEMKLHEVPAGVDVERFTPKEKFNDSIRMVYHGRVDKNRNVDKLIPLVERVRELGVDCELVIIGDGNALKNFNHVSRNNDWLKIIGPIPPDQIPSELSRCQIGVIPMGETENWKLASPLKLFEYAAAGLAIIGVDIEAHKAFGEVEWVRLFPSSEFISKGAIQIHEWTKDKQLFQRFSKEAITLVQSNHSWEKSARTIDSILREKSFK